MSENEKNKYAEEMQGAVKGKGVTRRQFIKKAAVGAVITTAATAAGPLSAFGGKPPKPTEGPYGWMGKILEVDLTNGTTEVNVLDMEDENNPMFHIMDYTIPIKDYIGGRGLGVKILYEEVGPNVGPLDPENVLVFAAGPLCGTESPTSGRYSIISKSPLASPKGGNGTSGAIFDASSGGHWGPEFRFTGFDAIIIRGMATTPKYLWIKNDAGEIREILDASQHWGKDTLKTTTDIRSELGEPQAEVACIGPAGENLARIAAVINGADEEGRGRACGRDGAGAVMGSKNLKAVVVRGGTNINIKNLRKLRQESANCDFLMKKNSVCGDGLPHYGTAVLVNPINGAGVFPARNFQTGVFDRAERPNKAERISGEAMRGEIDGVDKTLQSNEGCYSTCNVMQCTRINRIMKGEWKRDKGEGPEYESVWAFGAQCGCDDLNAACKANFLCNELGLDTISMGNTIGCAMELCEKGYLEGKGYFPGDIQFGDSHKMVELVEATAYRANIGEIDRQEGSIGDMLAEGSWRMANEVGYSELSMSVKKLELPAYDGRGVKAHGLAYATSNRGGCHVRAYLIAAEVLGVYCGLTPPDIPEPTPEYRHAIATVENGKIELVKVFQDLTAAIDSVDLCLFTVFAMGADNYAKLLSAATGIVYTGEDLMKVGERIWNLERLFNNREGFTPDDDRLPDRMEQEPMPGGPAEGEICEIEDMLQPYYSLRGWDSNGEPTDQKLQELGLL